jgi:hypothetical protein
MSAKTETIHVRISPGLRMWQVLLMAAALVACLFLGLALGRASAPAGAEHTFNARELAPYTCTGHVPNPACELNVGRGYGHTAHVPAGGSAAYG